MITNLITNMTDDEIREEVCDVVAGNQSGDKALLAYIFHMRIYCTYMNETDTQFLIVGTINYCYSIFAIHYILQNCLLKNKIMFLCEA